MLEAPFNQVLLRGYVKVFLKYIMQVGTVNTDSVGDVGNINAAEIMVDVVFGVNRIGLRRIIPVGIIILGLLLRFDQQGQDFVQIAISFDVIWKRQGFGAQQILHDLIDLIYILNGAGRRGFRKTGIIQIGRSAIPIEPNPHVGPWIAGVSGITVIQGMGRNIKDVAFL